jgi:hypothetical protein
MVTGWKYCSEFCEWFDVIFRMIEGIGVPQLRRLPRLLKCGCEHDRCRVARERRGDDTNGPNRPIEDQPAPGIS